MMGRDFVITTVIWIHVWSSLTFMYSMVSLGVYTLTKLRGQTFDKSRWPPMLGNHLTADSVRTFWNNTWQCVLRRHFPICGYEPVSKLFSALRASGQIPHYCGIIGAFTISGLLHEFIPRSTSRRLSRKDTLFSTYL